MYIVAVTGASGSIIGIKTIIELVNAGYRTGVIFSDTAIETTKFELTGKRTGDFNIMSTLESLGLKDASMVTLYRNDDFFASPASGSAKNRGMIIAPASMKTLSAVAHGYSDSLLTRAADVSLKENRPLVLVPRESPLSLIHLKNLLAVKEAGADIILPVPSFYQFPKTIEDVVDNTVGRILQLLGIESNLQKAWLHE